MEEGPEPQELIERTVEHHHHEHGHKEEGKGRPMMASAITAAVLAVSAAVGSLLSGHAANEGILNESKATDQWSYFQAKSTKQQIYEADRRVVESVARLQGADPDKVKQEAASLEKEAARYNQEKEEIKEKAEELEHESTHKMEQHGQYSYGVAFFQVGIVLASVSILIRQQILYFVLYALSLAAGIAGIVFLLTGFLMR
jgi:hypothetical protein